MVKYVLIMIGIIAAAIFLGRVRSRAPVVLPRQEPTYTEKHAAESRATTSAVSENPSGADGTTDKKIQSLPVIKKESAAPVVLPPTIIAQKACTEKERITSIHRCIEVIVTPASASPPTPIVSGSAASSSASSTVAILPVVSVMPPPPLNEKAIFAAVVKIECPSEDRKGKYVASGFAMPHGVIITAAHFIKDSGSDTCQVIFPHDRAPSVYLVGKAEDREQARKRHDEQGIDVAFLFMPLLAAYPEAAAVFPDGYPSIPYPVCADPALLGDRILHYGYPSSFQNSSYLDMSEGKAVVYADINGITEELSEDQTYLFKTPVFGYTSDQSQFHPYLISQSPSFYGDSGGLAFDATRQCIVGPDRGGTIGGSAGENFSVFMVLGWEGVRSILP